MKKITSLLLIVTMIFSVHSFFVQASENIYGVYDDTFEVTYGGKTLPLKEYDPRTGNVYFTDDGTPCQKHETGGSTNCKDFEGSSQCLGFAFYVQKKLFGGCYKNYNQQNKAKYDVIKSFDSNAPNKVQYIKTLFANVRMGAHIRAGTHSMIYVKSNDTYVWTYEANVDYRCRVRLKKRTWAEMYGYIQKRTLTYIASPKEELFTGTEVSEKETGAQTNVDNVDDRTQPKSCWIHFYNSYGKCKSCGKEYSISLKSMSATTYQAVKNDVPVRNRPYAPETITKYLSKGTKVTVVASGKNSAGNLWYKVNDGSWIYSKNLEKAASSDITNSGNVSNNGRTIDDGIYVIETKLNRDYVLDVSDASTENGANVQIWKKNGTGAQSFRVTYVGDGYYTIVNTNSGKAVDVCNGATKSETNVWQYTINNTDAQLWKIVSAANGSYYIIGKGSGLYLDVDKAEAASGTNVKIYVKNEEHEAQKWYFTRSAAGGTTSEPSALDIDLTQSPSTINQGSMFGLRGTVTSNYKITSVKGYIINSSGSTVQSTTDTPNAKSMDIRYANVNQNLLFDKLSSGEYTLKIVATDASGKSRSSLTFFNVKGTEPTPPVVVAPPAPASSIRFELEAVPSGNLPYGKSFSLKGWFRSDCPIVEARAYMLDANKNVVMQSDKASSTTSNYKIQGYKLDNAMKFNKLSPGAYYLKYYVKDANGDTAEWISDKFYIVK